jgi:hypothetical protein
VAGAKRSETYERPEERGHGVRFERDENALSDAGAFPLRVVLKMKHDALQRPRRRGSERVDELYGQS